MEIYRGLQAQKEDTIEISKIKFSKKNCVFFQGVSHGLVLETKNDLRGCMDDFRMNGRSEAELYFSIENQHLGHCGVDHGFF